MNDLIKFPKETDAFYETVKQRVSIYFKDHAHSTFANHTFYLKSGFFLLFHLGLYITLLFASNLWIALGSMILMGPLSIIIGINISHDAAHGSISKTAWVNRLFLSLLDVMGANSYMWKNRHVFSHHTYPNILNQDADLKQNPLVRIFPSDEIKPHHKYQFIYTPFLYLLYTLNWLLFRDFQDFKAKKIGSFKPKKHSRLEVIRLISFKLFYLSYIILIPTLFSALSFPQVLLGYVLMNFAASIFITVAIVPSHVAEDSNFPLPDKNGWMPHSWSHHQVLTVIDFATESNVLNFLFGGFNHHLAHHLFPHICHIHYTAITPIVRETVREFGLEYRHQNSLVKAYHSHLKLLKNNGELAA